MFDFTDRERQIIFFIFSKHCVTANSIASLFNVSEKTIRNEIKTINSICQCNLIISNKNGYLVDKQYDSLIEEIPLFNTEKNDYNNIVFLLLSNECINLFDLSESLSLSDTTLEKRLVAFRKSLKKYDLTLTRSNNNLSLNGTSFNKRKLYIDTILEKVGSNFYNINNFEPDFPNVNIEDTVNTLSEILKSNNASINEFYLNNFLLNLLTILNFDFDNDIVIDSPYDQKIHDIAIELDKILNHSTTNKTLPIYCCLAGVIESTKKHMSKFENEIEEITRKTLLKYSLDIDVSSFLNIFSKHISDMITRCKHNNLVQIDGGMSIKESCFYIYDVAVNLANEITKKYNITINENEISLISMHIGFAIENYLDKTIQNDTLNIAINTSQYLSSENFISKIKEIIPADTKINIFPQLETVNSINNSDLFITTSNLNLPISIPKCIVTPILTNDDRVKIKALIETVLNKKKMQHSKNLFNMFFNERLFFVNTELNNRDDVLNFLFSKLRKEKIIDQKFSSSVLVREAMTPTCINNKYSIPHAMDFIAKKTIISVFINPNGIVWDDQVVKIVFLSAINKSNIVNLRIIYDFVIDMVSDDTIFAKLTQSSDIDKFYSILFSEY
ncbi:BglG family transcription antiterminator [Anaerorhabdus sp.]|uniref:BglG family transcription antiterminator n=1 Tax=Anaerorhabdus sp. TaxID=1872524 RepID=UPI002FCA84E1